MDARAPVATAGYSGLQKTLHWIVALAVFGLVPVGLVMAARGAADIWDALTNTLYSWHKLIGFTVLWLMLVRLLVRATRGAPALPASVPAVQRMAASAVHAALYVLLIAVPMTGWAGVTAYPALVTVGGWNLPAMPFVPQNADLAGELFKVHGSLAIILGALVLAHIAAGLMHLVVKKDGVFERMLPGARDAA